MGSRHAAFAAALLSVSVLAATASAATLLEFNFNSTASGSDVTASATKAGNVSNTATLNGTAAVVTGAITSLPGGSSNFISGVSNGYLSIPRANSSDTSGIVMKDTDAGSGNNAEYRDYVSGTTGYSTSYFGTSTILFVYQPNNASMGTARHALFSANANGTTNSGIFLYTTTDNKIQLELGQGDRLKGSVSIAAPTWDTSKWYVIAASWTSADNITLFWQELTSDSSTGTNHYAESATAVADGSDITTTFAIGVRKKQDGSLLENAEGKIAYFQWTDQYTSSETQFDNLVNSLYAVPELSSLGLLSASSLLILRRNRNSL